MATILLNSSMAEKDLSCFSSYNGTNTTHEGSTFNLITSQRLYLQIPYGGLGFNMGIWQQGWGATFRPYDTLKSQSSLSIRCVQIKNNKNLVIPLFTPYLLISFQDSLITVVDHFCIPKACYLKTLYKCLLHSLGDFFEPQDHTLLYSSQSEIVHLFILLVLTINNN